MKAKNKKDTSLVILLILFFTMIALLAVIIVLNFKFRDPNDWNDLLFNLMDELLSAIIIGLFIGLITKIITNKLFSVEINMKKMREKGIYSIGDGKSNYDDIRKMFGSKPADIYPYEIKLLFLTGNVFLRDFKSEIVECLNKGTVIHLLIASPEKENDEYLKRCSKRFANGSEDYAIQITDDSLKTISQIKRETKNPDNFIIRFYRDEYQNNVRVSKYWKNDKEMGYYWINVQPISKSAIDLSIALKGYIDYEDKNREQTKHDNICLASENGFNDLWVTYKGTEHIADKYL